MERDSNGRFLKGNNGKPKGATNKATRDLKELITKFTEDNFTHFKKNFKQLPIEKQVEVYLKLLEFNVPKLQRTEFSGELRSEERCMTWVIQPVAAKGKDAEGEGDGQSSA